MKREGRKSRPARLRKNCHSAGGPGYPRFDAKLERGSTLRCVFARRPHSHRAAPDPFLGKRLVQAEGTQHEALLNSQQMAKGGSLYKGSSGTPILPMNRNTPPLISKGLRVFGSWSQCVRESERRLSMNLVAANVSPLHLLLGKGRADSRRLRTEKRRPLRAPCSRPHAHSRN